MRSMKVEKVNKLHVYALLLFVSVLITLTILPISFVNVPRLKVGDVSPVDVRSPLTLKVEDVKATQKAREEAKLKILPLYKYQPSVEEELKHYALKLKGVNSQQLKLIVDVVSSYYAKGVVSELPSGYQKVVVIMPSGDRVTKRASEFIRMDELKHKLREDISTFIENSELVDKVVRYLFVRFKPNYVYQRAETEKLWRKAESSVRPIYITLEKGEVVVKRGEKVSADTAKKIEVLRKERWKGKTLNKYVSILAITLMVLCAMVELYRITSPEFFSMRNLTFSLTSVVLDVFLIKILTFFSRLLVEIMNLPVNEHYIYVPVFTSTIFASMFLTRRVAVIHSLPVAILPSFLLSKPQLFILPVALGGIASSFSSRQYRSRNVIYKSSLAGGSAVATMQILMLVYYSGFKFVPELAVLPVLSFIGSLISAVVVNGLSPVFVYFFRFSTDMVYMELVNLNHPLLKHLVLRAPGTYSHSVMVATLAEAAAEAVGANPMLAKAGGLFHDIGKMKNPQAFIENQADGVNIHDRLPPDKSAGILRSHVEYGEELAERFKLPESIVNIIKEHHGTRLMKYFYHKAKEQWKGEVEQELFRYAGPKPRSKESGIVMLADTVEAGVRSMRDKNVDVPSAVHRLIMEVLEEGQLEDSGLSLKDISTIEKVFCKVLSGVYHNRVEYPDGLADKRNT